MAADREKEGVSVKEIEDFTKKHRFEVIFCIAFAFACFFSFAFFGPGWSVTLASIGGILGLLASSRIEGLSNKGVQFFTKQENMTQLILGGVIVIISIFLPPLIYLFLGAHGGKSIAKKMRKG